MVCAESEQITVAVSANDLQAGDIKNRERHPVAIALRQSGVDDARVSKREVLIRRGNRTRQSPCKAKMASG
jgi:tRNA-binding EMAP/Myf-like protein